MTHRRFWMALLIGVSCVHSVPCLGEDRIWLEAAINGKKVKLMFDSGTSTWALVPQAAKRLGLKFIAAPTNDLAKGFLAGETEQCSFKLEGTEGRTSFVLLDWPRYDPPDFDGLIGWPMFSRSVFRIDANDGEVEFLSKPPKRAYQWAQFTILTNSGVLDLEVPHDDGNNGVLYVDTGSSLGLELPPRKCIQWKETHPHAPVTLNTTYSPADGFYIYEEAWADEIAVGSLVLTGVPIESAGDGNVKRLGDKYEGTLGMAALKRLDIIVDGLNNKVFMRPKKNSPPPYSHNRLGAIFVPTDEHTNAGVAYVIKGGPAYEAGVRNGDVLVAVDDVQVKGWTWNWLHRFELRAGTKLKLTLKRQDKEFETTATLREILKPDPRAK